MPGARLSQLERNLNTGDPKTKANPRRPMALVRFFKTSCSIIEGLRGERMSNRRGEAECARSTLSQLELNEHTGNRKPKANTKTRGHRSPGGFVWGSRGTAFPPLRPDAFSCAPQNTKSVFDTSYCRLHTLRCCDKQLTAIDGYGYDQRLDPVGYWLLRLSSNVHT